MDTAWELETLARQARRRRRWIIAAIVAALLLFYPAAMLWRHQINADVTFTPPPAFQVANGSHAVAMAAALVDREINDAGWVANTPFPFPSYFLDNMPNFQLGLMYAISRFAIEMTDSLGRTRGSSQVDPDLDKASGLLKYDGTVWHWEPSVSIFPTAAAETQYLAGMRSLMSYNQRLGAGHATFDRRADNLKDILERIAADLGSTSAAIADRVADWRLFGIDRKADDVFYNTKGRLYGYYMILTGIGRDFEKVIADRRVEQVWQQMMDSMRAAAELQPWVVSNAAPDSLLLANHLSAQGFELLRARTQMREVTSVLAN